MNSNLGVKGQGNQEQKTTKCGIFWERSSGALHAVYVWENISSVAGMAVGHANASVINNKCSCVVRQFYAGGKISVCCLVYYSN